MVQFLSHFVFGYGKVSNTEYKTEENRTETKHQIEPQQLNCILGCIKSCERGSDSNSVNIFFLLKSNCGQRANRQTHTMAFVQHLIDPSWKWLCLLALIRVASSNQCSTVTMHVAVNENQSSIIVHNDHHCLIFHTCPILSTRFQWTKPGVRRSLVEKWNRKFSRVHLSYRKFSHDMKPEV